MVEGGPRGTGCMYTYNWTGKGQFSFQLQRKGNAKECSNDYTVVFSSHASNAMFKILQSRFQQYVNWELPDVQAEFRKGRGTRDQIANILWIIEKRREFQKNHLLVCDWLHRNLWLCGSQQTAEILKEMRIQDHLPGLLRNLYAGQEATVRTRHRTMDWFKIGERVHQVSVLSSCLFNFYAEYIMQNARLNESQAGIKIARRNVNNLRYVDNITQMAESKKEIKSLLMKVK